MIFGGYIWFLGAGVNGAFNAVPWVEGCGATVTAD